MLLGKIALMTAVACMSWCCPAFAQFASGTMGHSTPARTPASGTIRIETPQQELLDKLDAPVKLEFYDTPLQDVCDFLSELLDIKVHLDRRSLTELGVSTDEPITIVQDGIPLRMVLDLVLLPLEVDYYVTGEVLVVTTVDVTDTAMQTVVLDITGILADDFQEFELTSAIQGLSMSGEWVANGGSGGALMVSGNMLMVTQTQRGLRGVEKFLEQIRKVRSQLPTGHTSPTLTVTYRISAQPTDQGESLEEKLAGLIQTMIAPDSWQQGGSVNTVPGAIIVTQTAEIQAKIQSVLAPFAPDSGYGIVPAQGSGFF